MGVTGVSNSSWDVDLPFIGFATIPPGDRGIVASENLHRANDTMLSTLKECLDQMAHHPTAQDVPSITTNVDWLLRPRRQAIKPSPVNRLPPEILVYVFELYVAHGTELMLVPTPAHGPFNLAQVCKYWGAVAESSSRLWTSVQFYFPDSHQSRGEDVLSVQRVFDLHMKRSAELPMSFTFTDRRIYHPATEDLISLLADRLRTYARRWTRISLRLSCGYFPRLFTFTPCDLSSLEHLHISGDVFVRDTVTALRLDLESAKNLKSLDYSGPGYSVDNRIDVHWESLAEVSLGFTPGSERSFTLSMQFKHLIQCQGITTCSLGIDRPVWPDLSGGQIVTLPCLQTLRVRRLSADSDAHNAINPLILPQLRTLEIDACSLVTRNQRWNDHAFSDLLARSGCSLRRLSVQDVDFSNDELLRCLALSPELISFRFIPFPRSQDISDITRVLRSSPTGAAQIPGQNLAPVASGPLIPRLRKIVLATSVEGYLDLMLDMFRSRVGACAHAAGVAVLRRAEVVFFDMSHGADAGPISVPGARLGRLTNFSGELARWVSENKNNDAREDGDGLEASVAVDTSYLSEYIQDQ